MELLIRLFNVILKTAKMPDEWRWSTMVSVYKINGDIQNYNNYSGIKLLSPHYEGSGKSSGYEGE